MCVFFYEVGSWLPIALDLASCCVLDRFHGPIKKLTLNFIPTSSIQTFIYDKKLILPVSFTITFRFISSIVTCNLLCVLGNKCHVSNVFPNFLGGTMKPWDFGKYILSFQVHLTSQSPVSAPTFAILWPSFVIIWQYVFYADAFYNNFKTTCVNVTTHKQ